MAAGAGAYVHAIAGTVLVMLALMILGRFEDRLLPGRTTERVLRVVLDARTDAARPRRDAARRIGFRSPPSRWRRARRPGSSQPSRRAARRRVTALVRAAARPGRRAEVTCIDGGVGPRLLSWRLPCRRAARKPPAPTRFPNDMIEIFKAAIQRGASDIHIKAGDFIRARISGRAGAAHAAAAVAGAGRADLRRSSSRTQRTASASTRSTTTTARGARRASAGSASTSCGSAAR
jgi:hypothetical protein